MVIFGNRFAVLDSGKEIYSKRLSFVNVKNAIWSPNSMFFIINDDNAIYLFNTFNMQFNRFSNFSGNITVI